MKKVLLLAGVLALTLSLAACGKKAPEVIETEPVEVETKDVESSKEETETEEMETEDVASTESGYEEVVSWVDVLSVDNENGVVEVMPNGTLDGDTVFFNTLPVSLFLDFIDDNIFAESGSKMNREMFYHLLAINVMDTSWTEGTMYLFEMANAAELCMACGEDIVEFKQAYVHMELDSPDIFDHIDYVAVLSDGSEVLVNTQIMNDSSVVRTINGEDFRTSSSQTLLQGLTSIAGEIYGDDMMGAADLYGDDEDLPDDYGNDVTSVSSDEIMSKYGSITYATLSAIGSSDLQSLLSFKIGGKDYDLADPELDSKLVAAGFIRKDDSEYVTYYESEDSWGSALFISVYESEFSISSAATIYADSIENLDYNGVSAGDSIETVISKIGAPDEQRDYDISNYLTYNFESDAASASVELYFYEGGLHDINIYCYPEI